MKISVKQFGNILYEASILNEDILNGGEIYLGREDDCHIQLDNFLISRHHASILKINNDINLKVLSDHGGVKVNGNEVHQISLRDNDKIQIGDYEIILSDIPIIESTVSEKDLGSFEDDSIDSEDAFNTTIIESPAIESELEGHIDDKNGEELAQLNIVEDPAAEVGDDFELESGEDNLEFGLDSEEGTSENDEFSEQATEQLDTEGLNNFESHYEEPVDQGHDGGLDVDKVDDYASNELENSIDENNQFDNSDDFGNENFGNDGFGDDDFGGSDGFGDDGGFGGGDDATQVIQSFAKLTLSLFGEFAPFDKFIVDQDEVFIGRDSGKCQIVLDDPEVSKVHAKLLRSAGGYQVEDLNSANGIIFNGERLNQSFISNGDEFVVGDTTFTAIISSDIIEAEKDILMPVEDDQEVEIEEIVEEEVDFDEFADSESTSAEIEEKSFIKRIMKDPKKKRVVIILIVVFLALWLMEEEPKSNPAPKTKKKENIKKEEVVQKEYSPEVLEKLEQNYALALAKFNQGEYYEAKEYIDIVKSVNPNYKDTPSLSKLIQEGLDQAVRLKQKEREEKERKERQLKISQLLEKAKKAVESREVEVAKNYFNMILQMDPENLDVPPLKLEIEAYEADQLRAKQEADRKKALRQSKVDKLKPGKTLYLQGKYYKAIDALEAFLKISDMDEDLIKEATSMLQDSKTMLLQATTPLLSKARSFKEGEDLKQAYETYGEVLVYDPSNEEALDERNKIFNMLRNRSMKVYREGLISESLSLFSEAKEKFQEVQQISPINSEYYIKATEKLQKYLD